MSAAGQAASNTAAGQALPTRAPNGTIACPNGMIRIGIFFDGTGNNMYRDWGASHGDRMSGNLRIPPPVVHNPWIGSSYTTPSDHEMNAPSNVAKLYETFQEAGEQKKVYLVGIGAGDEGTAADDDGSTTAQATGYGGAYREGRALDALSEFFNTGNYQLAEEKRVDVFGFSRGSALARDFINKVRAAGVDDRRTWEGQYRYLSADDIELDAASHGVDEAKKAAEATPESTGEDVIYRVKAYKRTTGILWEFLGVFDTVGSFGLGAVAHWGNAVASYDFTVMGRPAHSDMTPDAALAQPDVTKKEQWVHRTMHCVAEDEYRQLFTVDLLGLDPKESGYKYLPKYLRERGYPGAHSDVGGGYRKSADKSDQLSFIPLRDMHAEALLGHVPLNPLSSLPANVWQVGGELEEAYGKYVGERKALWDSKLTYHVAGGRGMSVRTIRIPKWCDYTHDTGDGDLTYLQAMPDAVFDHIQTERQSGPGYSVIADKYVHDSNTGTLRYVGWAVGVVNWTHWTQRGVNYRAPQNSYDPDSTPR
ncbi:MAG TPA: DUF2235 domain-containing protein [Byssovorax sp.]